MDQYTGSPGHTGDHLGVQVSHRSKYSSMPIPPVQRFPSNTNLPIPTNTVTHQASTEATDIPSQRLNQRRSRRVHIRSQRGQAYFEEVKGKDMCELFPHNGDEIVVRWVLNDKEVWWPASVIDIEEPSHETSTCRGTLLYHQLKHYNTEYMKVVFIYIESSRSSLVSAATDNTAESSTPVDTSPCSWLYKENLPSKSPIPNNCTEDDTSAVPPGNELSPHDHPDFDTAQHRRRNSSNKEFSTHIRVPPVRPSILKHSTARKKSSTTPISSPHRKAHHHTSTTGSDLGIQDYVISPEQDSTPSRSTVVQRISGDVGDESKQLRLRLELLERKVQDINHTKSPQLSLSAQSIIVALKWNLLLQLEKPLKELRLEGLSQLGIASHTYKISTQCDYSTFRELAASLESVHACTDNPNRTGRLAFSPSFDIVRSSSGAADNLVTIFSTMADLTDFLQIRDQQDYESILSKEIFTDEKSLIRLAGTFAIEDSTEILPPSASKGDTNSLESISVFSSKELLKDKVIRIYVASSPVSISAAQSNNTSPDESGDNDRLLKTTLIEQSCVHFSTETKSFQSKWRSFEIQSDFKVSCFFDLDGVARPSQLKTYFTLTWSRIPAPSTKKWTRDVHDIGNNSPGSLTLSFPSVFVSARKSVEALLSIIDRNIESFMDFRSELRRRSSSTDHPTPYK